MLHAYCHYTLLYEICSYGWNEALPQLMCIVLRKRPLPKDIVKTRQKCVKILQKLINSYIELAKTHFNSYDVENHLLLNRPSQR